MQSRADRIRIVTLGLMQYHRNVSLISSGISFIVLNTGGMLLKRGSEQVRTPSGTRAVRLNMSRNQSTSVGAALRKAKRNLVVRRFIYIMLAIITVTAIATLACTGHFGKLIQYFIDRLM